MNSEMPFVYTYSELRRLDVTHASIIPSLLAKGVWSIPLPL